MNMKKNNSGFSMIEVLVASTIMIMIVMMLGMLFQQSSLAWRTGKQRADTYQQVRALFGAIQRDASAAIDQYSLPRRLFEGPNAPLSSKQTFDSGSLAFYTLTGTGFDNEGDAHSGDLPRRSLTFVQYSKSGQRTVTTFVPVAGGGFSQRASPPAMIVTPNTDGARLKDISFQAYYVQSAGPQGQNGLPSYLTLTAGVNVEGVKSFDVGVASGGPDRTLGRGPGDIRGRDDIKTWVD